MVREGVNLINMTLALFKVAFDNCLRFEVIETAVFDRNVVHFVPLKVLREVQPTIFVLLRGSLPLHMKLLKVVRLDKILIK